MPSVYLTTSSEQLPLTEYLFIYLQSQKKTCKLTKSQFDLGCNKNLCADS